MLKEKQEMTFSDMIESHAQVSDAMIRLSVMVNGAPEEWRKRFLAMVPTETVDFGDGVEGMAIASSNDDRISSINGEGVWGVISRWKRRYMARG